MLFYCWYLLDHSTPASQSPHSSNPSSLPSSPPTHNHNSVPFSNFGPIGTPDNRDRRTADRWKTDKPGEVQTSCLVKVKSLTLPFSGVWCLAMIEHLEFLSLCISQPWVGSALIISQQHQPLRAVGIRPALQVAPGQATAPPWRIPLLSSWKA